MRQVSKVATLDMTQPARIVILAFLASMLTATMALGQQPQVLTLGEAIELARRNNPIFLSTQNDEAAANWAVRSAYSRLLVPDWRLPRHRRAICRPGVGVGPIPQNFSPIPQVHVKAVPPLCLRSSHVEGWLEDR